jgi:citrate lyase subunit beta / citryl-CoA lyase
MAGAIMIHRSWLFAPGDSAAKLEKLAQSGADAVVLDLEDAVAPQEKPNARQLVSRWLTRQRDLPQTGQQRWVRINGIGTPWWREDLDAALDGAPHGVFLPKLAGIEQLQVLNAAIHEGEQRRGLPAGSVGMVPQLAETPAAALAIRDLAIGDLAIRDLASSAIQRLAGFNWGAEDLAAALGAARKQDDGGGWTDVFRFVRAQVLLAAHARGVQAIDAAQPDFRDLGRLERIAVAAAADGFTGMLAIHPAQVPVINAAFAPGPELVARAHRIVASFAANPAAGALSIDGQLVELPHLEQARRVLARIGPRTIAYGHEAIFARHAEAVSAPISPPAPEPCAEKPACGAGMPPACATFREPGERPDGC